MIPDEDIITLSMDLITIELNTFQWAYPDRGENRGELYVDYDERKLVLVVWCRDNDDPDDEAIKPLNVTKDVTDEEPRHQIRSIIHDYLCHEADEQMWFDNDRPFYPHA
jgi:hypothetical protein